jgi:hypothetical protein
MRDFSFEKKMFSRETTARDARLSIRGLGRVVDADNRFLDSARNDKVE